MKGTCRCRRSLLFQSFKLFLRLFEFREGIGILPYDIQQFPASGFKSQLSCILLQSSQKQRQQSEHRRLSVGHVSKYYSTPLVQEDFHSPNMSGEIPEGPSEFDTAPDTGGGSLITPGDVFEDDGRSAGDNQPDNWTKKLFTRLITLAITVREMTI